MTDEEYHLIRSNHIDFEDIQDNYEILQTNYVEKKKQALSSCNICNVSFKFETSFIKHLDITHKQEKWDTSSKCYKCHTGFPSNKSLNFHYSQEHSLFLSAPLTKCHYCGTITKRMKSHLQLYHSQPETKTNNLKCALCDFVCNQENELSFHRAILHKTRGKNQQCPFCGEVFRYLKRHIKTTNCDKDPSNAKEDFQCTQCGKIMSTITLLQKHTKIIHNQVRDKQCEECSYNTYSPGNLRLHINKVHLGKLIEKESCPDCGKKTRNLPYHTKIYHK